MENTRRSSGDVLNLEIGGVERIYFRYIKRAIVTKIMITTTTGNTTVVMVMGLYSSIWSCLEAALQSIGAHNDRYIYSTIKRRRRRDNTV